MKLRLIRGIFAIFTLLTTAYAFAKSATYQAEHKTLTGVLKHLLYSSEPTHRHIAPEYPSGALGFQRS